MRGSYKLTLLVLAVAVAAGLAVGRSERLNVLTAHGEPEIVVMDFSAAMPLDPPPAGWDHRRFWTRAPAELSFAVKDGVPALRFATRSSASMLFRHVDIDLAAYPVLKWRWYVEQPIDSDVDERTREGDDHPARLFLAFQTASGERRAMEIVWGNKLKAGDYKFIGAFPHYVADGGDPSLLHAWRAEVLDLRPVYRRIWPDGAPARLVDIALFCDSDDTRTSSVAYFADVRIARAEN